ncbi:excalibur calcium-binding domain-containing protein [Janibacter sp. UYMM211]|uniref:excalibur calcium-binding domain-containing protein n=1 Tax=Janibacter sp. UYMM211 TaxID=3156342 RepID=UPI003391CCA3
MRAAHRTALAVAAVSLGLATPVLASPALAAGGGALCEPGTTVTITSAADAATTDAVRDALVARGLAPAASGGAITATLAPADAVVDGGSPSVMAVAIHAGELDPAAAVEGSDWAPIGLAGGGAATESLLTQACGELEVPAVEAPAQAPAADSAPPAAPAAPAAAPAEAPVAAQQQAPAAAPPAAAPKAAAPQAAPAAAPQAAPKAAAPKAAAPKAVPAAKAAPAKPAAAAKAAAPIAVFDDKNCADFATQAEAQALYDSLGGVANDVHRLDSDRDGIPCETMLASDRSGAMLIDSGFGDQADLLGLLGGSLLVAAGVGCALRIRRVA